MLDPIPGMYRRRGRWPKIADPSASTATTFTLGKCSLSRRDTPVIVPAVLIPTNT